MAGSTRGLLPCLCMEHVILRAEDWQAMPSRAYAAWFSSLEGMRSPVLVGTQNAEGLTNLAIFNSLTHVGARPPLLGFVLRPLTVERHTYENLRSSGYYTINHMPQAYIKQAHQTSAKYASGVSEFDAVGLTVKRPAAAPAPYVAEASVSMLLEFQEEHHIAANDTIFIVGAVRELRVPRDLATIPELVDGKAQSAINWEHYQANVVSGLYNYYEVKHLTTMPYAQPD